MSNKAVEFKVVGLTFVETYPDNLLAAGTMIGDREKAAGWSALDADAPSAALPVALIRNPENEYDPNAVEIHLPALGRRRSMVGHVPADLAAKLAPSLDRGDEWDARLERVLVNPEHPDRPGAVVVMECVARSAVAV